MTLADKKLNTLLYSVEGVGAVFVVIYLAAYLGGLPTTNVLHNQPVFQIPLKILGGVLLVLMLASVIVAAWQRRRSVSAA